MEPSDKNRCIFTDTFKVSFRNTSNFQLIISSHLLKVLKILDQMYCKIQVYKNKLQRGKMLKILNITFDFA